MKKVTINVTDEDIRDGRRKNCQECPIALAIKRVFVAKVWVLGGDGQIGRHYVVLPDVTDEFIRKFDKGFPVEPFSFEIELPDDVELVCDTKARP